jgi:hypothetical protein
VPASPAPARTPEPSATPRPTRPPTPTATPAPSIRGEINDLIEQGVLEARGKGWGLLNVACAQSHLKVPESGDTFAVQPAEGDLAVLAEYIDANNPDFAVAQAAVWIATGADYDDLGRLVAGFGAAATRVIDETVAARGMKLVADAGLDVTQMEIWGDRKRIARSCEDPVLKRWLGGG